MAYYSEAWLDEVRQSSDIVDVVGGYVQLAQKGKRHWGLCPFHGEKTASFSVDAEKQLYYCFGCHAAGNVFRFVMEMERMEFPEAARHLAERAHIAVPETTQAPAGPSREQKDRLIQALTEAARWYYARLYQPEGAIALEYLHGRGLGDNTIRRFGLGATGEGWENLTQFLRGEGFTIRELEDAGLCAVRGERASAASRARAMSPFSDQRGRVVAVGGRVLGEGQPKYLNSSDTPVFNKRRTLYGLNFVKGTAPRLYLVEGYMDVVSLAQHGVHGCVATLGTALTPEQARLLRRAAEEVALVYDGDAAGQRATLRVLDIFAEQGITARVAVIPGGADPDDFVRQQGGQAFLEMPLKSAVDYRLDRAREGLELSSLQDRTAYATAAARILKGVDSALETETYVKRLAVETGFSREVLYEQIGRTLKTRAPADVSGNTRNQYRDTKHEREPDHLKAQKQLIALLAARQGPENLSIEMDDFTDPLCRELAEAMLAAPGDPQAPSRAVDAMEDEDKRSQAVAILGQELDCEPGQIRQLTLHCLQTIRMHALEERIQDVTERIQGRPPSQAPELYQQLAQCHKHLDELKRSRFQIARNP